MKHVSAILAISLAVSGCNQATGSAVAAATPDQSGKEIAAKIGSRSFSNAELDTRLKADMDALKARAAASEEQLKAQLADVQIQVKEQEFNLRKKALTEVLFDMEAQARGITRDALIAQEISAKAAVAPAGHRQTLGGSEEPRAGRHQGAGDAAAPADGRGRERPKAGSRCFSANSSRSTTCPSWASSPRARR